MRRVVEVPPRRPGIGAGSLAPRIHTHGPHLRHVDDQAAVVRPESRPAVPAAAHGKIEPVLAREVHRSDDVSDLLGLHDRQRPPVEHAVVNRARLVVALVARPHDAATNPGRKAVDRLRDLNLCSSAHLSSLLTGSDPTSHRVGRLVVPRRRKTLRTHARRTKSQQAVPSPAIIQTPIAIVRAARVATPIARGDRREPAEAGPAHGRTIVRRPRHRRATRINGGFRAGQARRVSPTERTASKSHQTQALEPADVRGCKASHRAARSDTCCSALIAARKRAALLASLSLSPRTRSIARGLLAGREGLVAGRTRAARGLVK